MIKLSSVASILFGIAWLVPSRADEPTKFVLRRVTPLPR